MKILVTGGTGFVGGHVVHALRAEDRPVRCLVRDPRRAAKLAGWGCELVQGDVTDPPSLARAVEGCQVVINLVAIRRGRPEQFERLMTQGTRDLVAAAQSAGVQRFVQMSAAATSEHSAAAVPYFRAKWDSEQVVIGSGLEHTIFRPSLIFGPDGGSFGSSSAR